MADDIDPMFEELYGIGGSSEGLIPWDIGAPQPVVQQLVAYGAVRGEVLDPGTGPGYHAIHFASQGYSTTGVDGSPSAIERARANAERAGVQVDFQVADATVLDGFEDRFDTVVDSAFYHVFSTEPELQRSYARALHRATKPGARLYMFEFGVGNINGFQMPRSLSEDDFRQVFPDAGWEITHLGPTTYLINMSVESLELMLARNPDMADQMKPLVERFRIIEPWLTNGRAHAPFWEMHATRMD